MSWTVPWDIVGRLVVAAVLGGIIGFEREIDNHPAGVRTFTAVALGAALFGAVSTVGFDEFFRPRGETNSQVDVTRVASQVVVGISFLGAGLIFRRGDSIVNLTTAAGLWTTAAVGLAAGVGNVGLAVATTVVLGLVLVALPFPMRALVRWFGTERHVVRVAPEAGVTLEGLRALIDAVADVDVIAWRTEKEDGRAMVECSLSTRGPVPLADRLSALTLSDAVSDLTYVT